MCSLKISYRPRTFNLEMAIYTSLEAKSRTHECDVMLCSLALNYRLPLFQKAWPSLAQLVCFPVESTTGRGLRDRPRPELLNPSALCLWGLRPCRPLLKRTNLPHPLPSKRQVPRLLWDLSLRPKA